MNKRERRFHRDDLQRARAGQTVVRLDLAVRRIDDRFQRRELRVNAELGRRRVLIRKLQLIGRIDLDVELDRLDRRPGQPHRFRAVAALGQRLDLQRAAERVRVVLQRDDAQHRRSVRIDQHDAAFE